MRGRKLQEKSQFYGITREDEEKKLSEVIKIADENILSCSRSIEELKNELGELRETFDIDEKEGLALWFNTDARYSEVRNDLLRAERARKKPYFGRIDFTDDSDGSDHTYYIGKSLITDNDEEPIVIDWRAPVASSYYESKLGECKYTVPHEGTYKLDLKRKRTYSLANDKVVDFFDSEVVANDDLLTKYLAGSKRSVLNEIIATIQNEQNEVIRKNPHHNILIQGSAGSGKTTVAMHRISYILYNYEREFTPGDFYIIGSNKVLLNYITGVLPDLDVYGVRQMTMEELFVRLLYEQWDDGYTVIKAVTADNKVNPKGMHEWFKSLEEYAFTCLKEHFKTDDIVLEKSGRTVMTSEEIVTCINDMRGKTFCAISERLTDLLNSKLEGELYGRDYLYNQEEQKKIFFKYRTYFARMGIKETVFDTYERFVDGQRASGNACAYVKETPDIYDLASMAYLYKVLYETEVIREATHVIIDEAQDFGLMVYESLKACLTKCTFTIMGDVSQNINSGAGLSDWEGLKRIMLPDPYDYFGILKKSYRNTIEISQFATDILRHGTFPIYPVEPIVRHGSAVTVKKVMKRADLAGKILDECNRLLREGNETIAVICRNAEECEALTGALSGKITLNSFMGENARFENGVSILPIEYSKGLEFDSVIVSDASESYYPKEDAHVRLLYVAATRALHNLTVFHVGKLTGIIKDPIDADSASTAYVADDYYKTARVMPEDTRTVKEIAKDNAKLGDEERGKREKYGPARIEIKKKVSHDTSESRQTTIYKPYSGHETVRISRTGVTQQVKRINSMYLNSAAGERKIRNSKREKDAVNEFATMPEGTSLIPAGHSRIDSKVRWVASDKRTVTITEGYGVLSVIPLGDNEVRITFCKGSEPVVHPIPDKQVRFDVRERPAGVEIVLKSMTVYVDKPSGAITFKDAKQNVLLSENKSNTRFYGEQFKAWWNYWDFGKKEILSAYNSEKDTWLDVSQSAKYISSTGYRCPCESILMSMKGYQIVTEGNSKILACSIAPGNSYIKFEDCEYIEYRFRVK